MPRESCTACTHLSQLLGKDGAALIFQATSCALRGHHTTVKGSHSYTMGGT
jgi:hypothetical protein